jgi:hypothetical protein
LVLSITRLVLLPLLQLIRSCGVLPFFLLPLVLVLVLVLDLVLLRLGLLLRLSDYALCFVFILLLPLTD